jgi:hypothetical protein
MRTTVSQREKDGKEKNLKKSIAARNQAILPLLILNLAQRF